MKKSTGACDISPSVRKEVVERDGGECIICGCGRGIEIAHYQSRGRLGLGVPQNLACLCRRCHYNYDNGNLHREIKNLFREHLKAHYEDWNENDLVYRKEN